MECKILLCNVKLFTFLFLTIVYTYMHILGVCAIYDTFKLYRLLFVYISILMFQGPVNVSIKESFII